jgi:hypothetical protein
MVEAREYIFHLLITSMRPLPRLQTPVELPLTMKPGDYLVFTVIGG